MKSNLIILAVVILGPVMGVGSELANPHSEAIKLVIEDQREYLEELEKSKSGKASVWHDRLAREWTSVRPFDPGYIDSTHWFNVTFKIEGEILAMWLVNLKTRTVQKQKKEVTGVRFGDPEKMQKEKQTPIEPVAGGDAAR